MIFAGSIIPGERDQLLLMNISANFQTTKAIQLSVDISERLIRYGRVGVVTPFIFIYIKYA